MTRNFKKFIPFTVAQFLFGCALILLMSPPHAMGLEGPVDLGTAGDYVILSQSGISTVPASAVAGDIGVSPIASTAITGFSLILDGSNEFSTSSQVTGKIYGADYAAPTPSKLTTAINDMGTAYSDAAGRTLPDFTELGAGNIGGLTLSPGLYKWGTGVTIPTDVTVSGGRNDVWIFQIAGSLSMAGGKRIILSGGARAANLFWQVAGGVGVDLGTGSHFEGILMSKAAIHMQTGASINGRLYAQTAVTLDANRVTIPASNPAPPDFTAISIDSDGSVALTIASAPGFALTVQRSQDLVNWETLSTSTPEVSPHLTEDNTGQAGANRFYRAFYP